jgi:hypothetical protein
MKVFDGIRALGEGFLKIILCPASELEIPSGQRRPGGMNSSAEIEPPGEYA